MIEQEKWVIRKGRALCMSGRMIHVRLPKRRYRVDTSTGRWVEVIRLEAHHKLFIYKDQWSI